MTQVVNTNIASLNAQRNLAASGADNATALQRLSSGLRINTAADDAAGLAISTRFDSQIRGTAVAIRNAGDGISLAQTADGALDSINNNLQRIRELAVQSANDTNTDLDRAALQAEVDQLVEEIQNVADTANFNGRNLLDGSFQNSVFQTGTNVGDTISVSIGQLDTDNLGAAASAGVTGNVDTASIAANAAAADQRTLVAGDLVVNGVSIGASDSASDNASLDLAASSAISRAAAINSVSDQTGVTATAAPNVVEGSIITAGAAAAAGTVTINGTAIVVDTAAAATLADVQNQLGAVAQQINDASGATGVTAEVVQANTGFRIDLTAADGRNITLNEAAAGDAADAGLATGGVGAAAAVFVGNVTLNSNDGSDIVLSSATGNIDTAGFEAGTFSGQLAQAVGDNGGITADGRDALASGDLLINGTNIGITLASDDNASVAADRDASGIALAAAINRSADATGVSATVNENTVTSAAVGAGAVGAFTINGTTINVAAGTSVTENLNNIISEVNDVAGQTGVTAVVLDADQFTLVAEDGRNIVVGGTVTNSGLTADVFTAGVTLESAGQFTVSSATGNLDNSGLTVGTFGGAESGQRLSDIDITTVDGANAAITAIDNAVNAVSSTRAELGAIQNRFEATISNLQISNENLNAANSRILDADFAAETAALSRSQVLQQAGISILAQANAAPQQVLSLLG